ncbi:MAG: ABC transporter substrate-binding protein [Planctomycetales bacterium]|nr:ABC transporter substrate-binding protein [Planctomycetales bacterium]
MTARKSEWTHPRPGLSSTKFGLYLPILTLLPVILFALAKSRFDGTSSELRIGINPWPGYEFATLADELGLIEATGAKVRLLEFSSLNDSRRAFERGQLDGLFCTLSDAVACSTMATSPYIAAVTDYSNGCDALVASSSIQSMSDLIGKRIGIEPNALAKYFLTRALEHNTLRIDDVVLVEFPQERLVREFMSGQLEAIVTYPPFLVNASKLDGCRTLFSSQNIPFEIADVLLVSSQLSADKRRSLDGLLDAFFRARDKHLEHPQECLELMARHERISTNELKELLQMTKLVSRSEQAELLTPTSKLAETIRLHGEFPQLFGNAASNTIERTIEVLLPAK